MMKRTPLSASAALLMAAAACAEPYTLTHVGELKTPAVLAPGTAQVSLQYGTMNDTVDFLDIRDAELGSITATTDTAAIGDYTHYKLALSYAPVRDTMVQGSIARRTVDYGAGALDVLSYGLSARYLLKAPSLSSPAAIAIDAGVRGNRGETLHITSAEDIQYYISKLSSSVTVSETDNYLWFTKTTSDATLSVGLPKDQNPEISIDSMSDRTLYARIAAGMALESWFPSLYVEGGQTQISTVIDTNMDDIAVDFQDLFTSYTGFPLDLDRSESYAAAGIEIRADGPWNTILEAGYEYKKIFRDAGLDYIADNHTLRAEVTYPITPNLSASIGGVYLERQFNGEIPFLYNRYTQSAFDHRYGWANAGISYRF